MTSFRYHVVSLLSVLLALAVGVALGAGPLQGRTQDTPVGRVASDGSGSDPAGAGDGLRRALRFDDDFAAGIAPALLASRLRGHEVTVVALPGADAGGVAGLVRLVGVAGGRVGGTFTAGSKLLDVAEKEFVDQLGSQLQARVPGVRVPAAGPYERMGALIAHAVGTDRLGGAPVDPAGTTILGALRAADLLSPRTRSARRGDLVLFVAGAGDRGPGTSTGAGAILTSLVHAVDAGTRGTVLTGPPGVAGVSAPVAAVRADAGAARDVSTVDMLAGTAGEVVTVLALSGQAAGGTGHYGAAGAPDGVLPSAPPAPPR